MGRKKKGAPKFEAWCWYCDRDFEDEKVLLQHQRAKHYRCRFCPRRLNTAGGLTVHLHQVHKAEPTTIDNALPGRDSFDTEIYGMVGIPEADLEEWQSRKASRGEGGAGANGDHGGFGSSKRPKIDKGVIPVERLKAQLEAHKALMSGKAPPPGVTLFAFGGPTTPLGFAPDFSRPPPNFARPPPPFGIPPPGMHNVSRPPPPQYAGPPPGYPSFPPPPQPQATFAPSASQQTPPNNGTPPTTNSASPAPPNQSYPAVHASVGIASHDPKSNTAEALSAANTSMGERETYDREKDSAYMQSNAQKDRHADQTMGEPVDETEVQLRKEDGEDTEGQSGGAHRQGRARAADLF